MAQGASRVILSCQQAQAFAALRQFPGRTIPELADLAGQPRDMLHRRLPELLRLGWVSRTEAGTWHPLLTAAGDPATADPQG